MASSDDKSILNWVDPADKSGEFKRQSSVFRNWISRDPQAEFPAEKGRYHLYVSYACPWAHRALIVRKLKGLEDIIPCTSVHWHLGEKGWRFATAEENEPGEFTRPDPIHPDYTHLRDIYFETHPDYDGRFTVPTLYDIKQRKIVSNESSEIIRMFYHEFDHLLPPDHAALDLYPPDLQATIDDTNAWTYDEVNNGVYKAGFATTPDAYTAAVTTLFHALDRIEAHLDQHKNQNQTQDPQSPYYHGARLTEADVRLYTTIIRFDPVYVQHFKCNVRDIRSGYPHVHAWMRQLYWNVPAFGPQTTDFVHIKKHYTQSHRQINPWGITPVGPVPDVLGLGEEVGVVRASKGAGKEGE